MLSCATTTLYAADNDKRPRRKTEKKYTSPEEIKSNQDSIVSASAIDTTSIATPEAEVEIKTSNTLSEIDSVLAMWRETSTVEYYERYFRDYVMAAERIDTTLSTSNMDSIYVERLNALMSPIPLEYNRDVRTAIERYTSSSFSRIMSFAYYIIKIDMFNSFFFTSIILFFVLNPCC